MIDPQHWNNVDLTLKCWLEITVNIILEINFVKGSLIITSPIEFDIVLTNIEAALKQCWCNVVSTLCKVVSTLFQRCTTLFWRCFNVGHWRCVSVVQRWKSDVGFCFIFTVGSTLLQRWSRTLKQRWSYVEMLTGLLNYHPLCP